MAEARFCLYCGKKLERGNGSSGPPRKYCDQVCYHKYCAQKKENERQRKLQEAAAKAVASDTSKPLVNAKKCAKCVYGYHDNGQTWHCGYMFKTGRTRLAQHPEGLTAECLEFAPRKRERKRKSEEKGE